MDKDIKQQEKSEKRTAPKVYSRFELDPNIKVGDIVKLGKITITQYKSPMSAVANEIPVFLRWIEQIQSLFLEQKAVSDRKIMLEMNKESQERLGTILLSMVRQFSPDVLYASILYYPDELENETSKYLLIEHKVYEERKELVVTKTTLFNPAIYKDKDKEDNKTSSSQQEPDEDISKKSILQLIGAKNIYTPLIVEKNEKNEKILNKFFLDYKGKGELFNYDKRLVQRYPLGTVIFPFAITNRVKFIFEIKFNEDESSRTSLFIVQFLKHLRNTIDRLITQSYVIKTCKGSEVLGQLMKRKDLTEIAHKKKAIIFLDIFDYSKLSIYIKDKNKTEEENEEMKYRFVNIFNLIVSEIVRSFDYSSIDKIVGDMHMVVLDEDPNIENKNDDEKDKDKELAERAFLLSWNIDLMLRSLNKKAKEIFEERDIDILNPDVYDKIVKANKDRALKLQLLTYPKTKSEKVIYLKMEEFVFYYYICKKFGINGIQVRIGFNIGYAAEIFLGGTRLDYTIIGKEVDLAARMEHLGKKNVIKFPAKIYPLFDDKFKLFIVKQIGEDSKLSNKILTLKMIFQTKKEYPKGYEKEGLSTIEFFMEVGYAYYEAQKTYEKLEALFEELTPDNLYQSMINYVERNQEVLIPKTRKTNPKFEDMKDNDIKAYIMTNKTTRLQIQKNLEDSIKRRIEKIIYDIRREYDVYHIVRTLVLNKSYELYRKYFPNDDLLSEYRKRDYFSEKIVQKIANNIDFKNVDKDDLDKIVDELYIKLTGKPD